ncbi:hypothetical protein DW083_11450 [Parabacteroides sp. AF48-14]|uniref:hypothetical protein n=1 Tax=Parabacteroides sp. AF48-14 TaxID=2292052 RepID=UPI000F00792B|nr:hypothetical protein [Parabacteroides sp. AF48-14]RHO71489.1 hypothetical protein DW083_11450 [Parabacteroides sp. AF48-14]
MKKIVNKIVLVSGAVALLLGMGLNLQYALDDYGLYSNDIVISVYAQRTGDFNDSDSHTFQIAEATRTEASGGWTFDAGLQLWFLNGKVQKTGPSSSYTVKYKCCRPKGDVIDCPYEGC